MKRTHKAHSLAAAVILAALPSLATAQQDGRPIGQSMSIVDPPVIDGRLDEGVWMGATPLKDFIQREPSDGQAATEPTEVRVLQDGQALYLGVWLFDSQPTRIIPGEGIRDYDLEDSDAVLLIFDTFRDEQNAFVFGTNPAGIEYDGQVANAGQGGGRFSGGGGGGGGGAGAGGSRRQQRGSGGGFNLNWDASWTVATSSDSEGWYAEFRIPFTTLRYGDGEEQTWGLNVARRVRRLNEQSFWSPVPREFNQWRLNYSGSLAGLQPPNQRLVRLTPYALQTAVRDYQAGDPDFDYPRDFGADAKVQITQGLTLDLTVNTDFAQVEVDDVRTNLTRFNISFPEKRPFFLENAGFFQVGTQSTDLFFSRRIGISSDGQVPILAGGRISGRAGGLNVGLLHIQMDDLYGPSTPTGPGPRLQAQNRYSVARVVREFPNRSRIGGAVMRRGSDVAGDWNNTYAVDGQLGLGEAVSLSSFYARTETPSLSGQDHALSFSGAYTTRDWNTRLNFQQVGADFNPELGFAPRTGYTYGQAHVMYYVRPEDFLGLREIRPHSSYFEYRDIGSSFVQSARWHIDSHFEWEDGMELHPGFNYEEEGLAAPFEVSPGITVPPGSYGGWVTNWVFFTNASAPISFNGGLAWGNFLNGNQFSPNGTVTARYNSSLSASLRLEHNDIDLPQGSFDATLIGVRLAYFVTSSIYVQSLTQWSNRQDAWSTNVRFGWLDDAGSGLFIVYNQANGFDTLSAWPTLNRAFTIKYSKLFDVARW